MNTNTMLEDQGYPIVSATEAPVIGVKVKDSLLPEYDIVQMFSSLDEIKSELPKLLRGEKVTLINNVGSNSKRPADAQRVPRIIGIGTGYTPEQFKDMQDSIDLTAGGTIPADQVPIWVKLGRKNEGDEHVVIPKEEEEIVKLITKLAREALDEARMGQRTA